MYQIRKMDFKLWHTEKSVFLLSKAEFRVQLIRKEKDSFQAVLVD